MPNVLAQTFKMLYIMIEQQKFLAQYFMYFSKYGQLKFAIKPAWTGDHPLLAILDQHFFKDIKIRKLIFGRLINFYLYYKDQAEWHFVATSHKKSPSNRTEVTQSNRLQKLVLKLLKITKCFNQLIIIFMQLHSFT